MAHQRRLPAGVEALHRVLQVGIPAGDPAMLAQMRPARILTA